MSEHQGEILPFTKFDFKYPNEADVIAARDRTLIAGVCPGPIQVSGAVFDPSAKEPRDRWINNAAKPSLEFCIHGYQTSHPLVSTKNKSGKNSNGRRTH